MGRFFCPRVVPFNSKSKPSGGCPTAAYFLLSRQKKVSKEKATPVRRRFAVPCVARLLRRLRNSRYALKQSSPKSPDQPPLLGGAQGKEKQKSKPQIGHFVAEPKLYASNLIRLPLLFGGTQVKEMVRKGFM